MEGRHPRVRLAELVASLSLGVDLGFGQPMEHVLRQCLIALRLAERSALDEQHRAAVYYTALLVNVGCHADAHEQAKWFGDDIALKSGKYAHELGSVPGALATMRLVGAGNPPLYRFRVGLEFALSGHRALDGMIAQHARLAQALAEQLGLPASTREAIGAAYEQWNGRGWPGELSAEAVPVAARIAQLAEFVEVAHRVSGVEGARALARSRSGKQFDPALAALLCAEADAILAGLDAVPAWQAVIAAEPALAVELSPAELDGALTAIANFVDLKFTVYARPFGRRRGTGRGGREPAWAVGREDGAAAQVRAGARLRPTRSVEFDLGQDRAAGRRRVGAGKDVPLPDRAHAASVDGTGAARRDRGAAPGAAGRQRVPSRAFRRRDLQARPGTRCRRCLPGDARATAPSARAVGGGRLSRIARRGPRGSPRSTPCLRRPAIACRAAGRR
jgi:hypothetical protein